MRSLKYLESDEVVIDKWGYAIFAGVMGLALAHDSEWFSLNLGFALGFFGVFFALMGLEFWALKIRHKRTKMQMQQLGSQREPLIVRGKLDIDLTWQDWVDVYKPNFETGATLQAFDKAKSLSAR